jgi:hypothetical protein
MLKVVPHTAASSQVDLLPVEVHTQDYPWIINLMTAPTLMFLVEVTMFHIRVKVTVTAGPVVMTTAILLALMTSPSQIANLILPVIMTPVTLLIMTLP